MILIDAGPLIAILDGREPDHERCVEALGSMRTPLLTTWPSVAEAMHLLHRKTGWTGQDKLWRLVLRQDVKIADIDHAATKRVAELMHKYRDLPMDLADATLVAVAEARKLRQIFTLDSDFDVYRLHGRQKFHRLPS